MTEPNFFIIGAPKCGTTALASYLAAHPEIFVSNPKEPLFYLDAVDPVRKIKSYRHYVALFKKVRNELMVGEASVWYLYSKSALKSIKERYPESKIIIMTRNPVAFVSSLHSQLQYGGWEPEGDLRAAWFREVERLESVDLAGCSSIEYLVNWRRAYPELANHTKYINMYICAFGAANVCVIDHTDFVESPLAVYERVLNFLGVNSDGRQHFPRVNANKAPRSVFIQWCLQRVSRAHGFVGVFRIIKSYFGIGTFGVYEKVKSFNTKESERQAVDYDLNEIIKSHINNQK